MTEPGLPRAPGGAGSRRQTLHAARLLMARSWPAVLLLVIATGMALAAALLLHHWGPAGGARPAGASSAEAPVVRSVPRSLPAAPDDVAQPVDEPTLAPDEARAINAAIPFMDKGLPARPFAALTASPLDRTRAIDCLAAAALYEAGSGDADGQRAVMQVVLNRVRHPAYPHSVCGVVFQGAERRTGCQFTFTCDGSLAYRYSDTAWRDARDRAAKAIDGAVFEPVGLATHYHTDWVHPYWSVKLDKLARVHTHLFFRWKGGWGTRPAFSMRYAGTEPRESRLSFLEAHAGPGPRADFAASDPGAVNEMRRAARAGILLPPRRPVDPARMGLAPADLRGVRVLLEHPQGGAYLVVLPPGMTRAAFDRTAKLLCNRNGFCRVQGWYDEAEVPRGFPIDQMARRAMAFEYVDDPGQGVDEPR